MSITTTGDQTQAYDIFQTPLSSGYPLPLKHFLKYWTVSISFDILSSEKSSTAPYKSWKKISSKLAVQGIKRNWILGWFQKCAKVSNLTKGKKNYRKTEFLRTGKILQKFIFCEKNLLELLHIFDISPKFRFFWYTLRPISKKFFQLL